MVANKLRRKLSRKIEGGVSKIHPSFKEFNCCLFMMYVIIFVNYENSLIFQIYFTKYKLPLICCHYNNI